MSEEERQRAREALDRFLRNHSRTEIAGMPRLAQGQADDMIFEDVEGDGVRIWRARCGREDGAGYDKGSLSVEVLTRAGNWRTAIEGG